MADIKTNMNMKKNGSETCNRIEEKIAGIIKTLRNESNDYILMKKSYLLRHICAISIKHLRVCVINLTISFIHTP